MPCENALKNPITCCTCSAEPVALQTSILQSTFANANAPQVLILTIDQNYLNTIPRGWPVFAQNFLRLIFQGSLNQVRSFRGVTDQTQVGRKLPVLKLPVLELPSLELPVLEQPGLGLPGLELPVLELPGLELPGLELPVLELPSLKLPVLELPVLERPDLELPGLELPGLERPVLELPGLELPILAEVSMLPDLIDYSLMKILARPKFVEM